MRQSLHIVIVGAGPSTTYLLSKLTEVHRIPLNITILEARQVSGEGEPFCEEGAYPGLLSNLTEDEIPESLSLEAPEAEKRSASTNNNAPVSRKRIGEYFNAAFHNALEALKVNGHQVQFFRNAEVKCISAFRTGNRVLTTEGAAFYADKVVLNVGSAYNKSEVSAHHFPAYPTYAYARLASDRFRVVGTSLSAIDAALSIAHHRGVFSQRSEGLTFETSQNVVVELVSSSATFPQIFYTNLRQNTYMSFLQKHNSSSQGNTLDCIFTCFLRLLNEFNRWVYLQIYRMTFASAIDFLLGRRKAVDPFQKLHIDLFAASCTSGSQDDWPALLEATLLYAETNIPDAHEAIAKAGYLRHLLTASMASIPKENAQKLLALHRAGAVSVTQASEEQLSSSDCGAEDKRICIDARGFIGPYDGLERLSSLLDVATYVNDNTRTNKTRFSVSKNQTLLINKTITTIYVGSGYLTPNLLRLPGLDICKSLSESVFNDIFRPAFAEEEVI